MEILHKGFDGLDVAFTATLTLDLIEKLEVARATAIINRSPFPLSFAEVELLVHGTGAPGGYRFRCDTGPLGAVWFFKLPNAGDPWGVRVSCRALPLALRGLSQVKADLYATMDVLGIRVAPLGESISRVDYAIDFLAPNFAPDPHCFVMHSRTGQATHEELESRISNGRSGRVTSITIGKSPNRQVILYDKRQEVLDKRKVHWPEIWNANRVQAEKPHLNLTNPKVSRVWRIEFRAMKKCLKDRWGISKWSHLDNRLADCMIDMVERIRYTSRSDDANRARWPDAPIWATVRREIKSGLTQLPSGASEPNILELYRLEKRRMLMRQGLGVMIGAAKLDRIKPDQFEEWLDRSQMELRSMSRDERARLSEKLG